MKKNVSTSKNESLRGWFDAFSKITHNMNVSIRVAYLAKVIKYDKDKHTADILPLANFSNGDISAQYLDVPVAEQCYIIDELIDRYKPELQKLDTNSRLPEHKETKLVEKLPKKKFMRKGVPVVVVVLDRDNDNWAGGRTANNYTPNTARMHDANDSIIVGVLGGDAVNG